MSSSHLPHSHYEDLQARMRGLLISIGAWISPEQLSLFNELVDANECGVALDMLTEALASANAKIDDAVIQDVRSLSDDMRLSPAILERLRPLLS
jgi:hypothetical protein